MLKTQTILEKMKENNISSEENTPAEGCNHFTFLIIKGTVS
jgi:hypothetical protein